MTRSTASAGLAPSLEDPGNPGVGSELRRAQGEQPTDEDKRKVTTEKGVKPGYFNSGEFGALQMVFDPKAKAEFEWDHSEVSEGKRLCVFRYQIAKASTNYVFYADGDRVPVGHHGLVYADCDAGMVMRFHMETDTGFVRRSGRDVPLGYELDVRFALTTIAGQDFLLPQVAESTALFYKTLAKAEVKFQQYRKYDTNSTITFGDR